jgi:hypothetical protein
MAAQTAADAHFVAAGDGEATWFLTNRMTMKATAEMTNGAFGLLESLIVPGFSPPLHVHQREDESFYVLEGELTMRGVPHTFVVEGDRPARMLTLITPGGGEAFFREAGRPAESDGLPPAAPPDIAALKRAGAMFGSEIVGPPMAPTRRTTV